jgi:UDPglucose 6-dehydrogenase
VACALGGQIRGKTIGILGLTFKPNTDDMREAPSIPLITALIDMGAKVKAYDPEGMQQARDELPAIKYCEDAYSAASGADGLVIVTEWEQFRALDLKRLKNDMARPVIVDLRNIYRPEDMVRHGFTYESVGRPHLQADVGFELEERGSSVGSRSTDRPAYISADMTARLEIAKARWD